MAAARRPRHRLVRAAAPCCARGPARGPRPGVRRPAAAAPGRPQRPAAAGQRPEAVAESLGVRADEVTFTASRHRGRAPRPARARAGSRRGRRRGPLRGRALRRAPRRRVGRRGRRRAVSTRGVGSTTMTWPGRPLAPDVGGRRPADRQPRGRHGAAGRRVELPGRRPALHRRLRLDGPAAAARRVGGGGGLGPQVGRAGGGRRAAGAQGSSLAQPVPRRRPHRRAGRRLRERARPRSPLPPRCRRWWPSATQVNARQHALVDRIRGRGRGDARHPGGRRSGRPTPPPGDVLCLYVDGEALVTSWTGAASASRAARPAPPPRSSPSHVLAAMGVLTHGNVRVSLTARHHRRRRSDAFLRAAARGGRPTCARSCGAT